MATGFLIGLVMEIGEEWVFVGRGRWRRYLWVTVVRVLLYTGVIVAALVLVNGASEALAADTRLLGGMATYVTGESMLRDLVLASMVAVVGTALLEVRHLHNPGAILDYLLGRYRFPVKEHRVFLFADLADSTSIAEHLGDQKYSRFIGDCYRDVAEAILAWSGRV